jgi:hypothetical protein
MSGNVLSLKARHTQNAALAGYGHAGWHVELRLQTQPANSQMRNALLRLRVINFRGLPVFDVTNVWRVQFVPTTDQDNKFHLRLFQNYENWEREAIVSDNANFFCRQTGSESYAVTVRESLLSNLRKNTWIFLVVDHTTVPLSLSLIKSPDVRIETQLMCPNCQAPLHPQKRQEQNDMLRQSEDVL